MCSSSVLSICLPVKDVYNRLIIHVSDSMLGVNVDINKSAFMHNDHFL